MERKSQSNATTEVEETTADVAESQVAESSRKVRAFCTRAHRSGIVGAARNFCGSAAGRDHFTHAAW